MLNLSKEEKIELSKISGESLKVVKVSLRWKPIETSFFGIFKDKESVDLDASVVLFDSNKKHVITVYYGNLKYKHNSQIAVSHSGDDLTGEMYGSKSEDNETITIDFTKLPENIETIAIILNSFRQHDFGDIPESSMRIYSDGEEFAKYVICKEPQFSGFVSMIFGKFYKRDNKWKFQALGEPTKDRSLPDTVRSFERRFI